ncbi:uncharacterized protein LOC127717859 isoform X2 [Mytilus californianus]|uniref:uncharacterized protein LOC127717859 isoform X2 n=1 Tax=Mytilus californianus TaxID=6549 RepID=UPI00224839F1|nr:uncharacterized protein LOC127717859 isoform X2 [Mytilus californianus]
MSIFSLAFWMRINLVVCVIDPPVVKVRKRKLSEDSMLKEIQCIAHGKPDSYNYFPWEHRSQFDEHIRYLGATDDRNRQLPEVNVSNTYQNTGFYICKVLNGIPDYHGNFLQQERVYVEFEGPPVFAANNKRFQKITKESAIKLKVNVYSSSQITCHDITEVGSISLTKKIGVTTRHILIKETFHGAIVTLNGTEIVFVLNGLNAGGLHSFNVTVCNIYGQCSIVLKSEYFVKSSEEKALSSRKIINIVLLVIILVLVTGVGVYVLYTKYRYRKKAMTSINIQTAERNVDESSHYAEIIEGDSILTQPQGNNTQIISETYGIVAENSNTTVMSDKHSSASSNTDINASEDLDDGYEKPYTTLVANHEGKDEHVYRKTKQNWTYENSTIFKNATFEHSVEFSLDKTKTNVYANEGQESANMDYGENDSNMSKKADDDFQRSNVCKQKETIEYINLSIKQ